MLMLSRLKWGLLILLFISDRGIAEQKLIPSDEYQVFFPVQALNIKVELAITDKQRKTGLMFRQALALDRGMLFKFESTETQNVWMRNVFFPIDVVFISRQGKVVALLKHLPPCLQQDTCPIYRSGVEAKYMLEINAGLIEQHNISIGQPIQFLR